MHPGHEISLDCFLNKFISGGVGPFGPWDKHVQSWLGHKNEIKHGFLLLSYEKMKEDTLKEVERVARFLGVEYDGHRLQDSVDKSSFQNIRRLEEEQEDDGLFARTNKKIKFTREGKTAGYREV
jgi:hypothetical protein